MANRNLEYLIKLIPDSSELRKLTAGGILNDKEMKKLKEAFTGLFGTLNTEAKTVGTTLNNAISSVDTKKIEELEVKINGAVDGFNKLSKTVKELEPLKDIAKDLVSSFGDLQNMLKNNSGTNMFAGMEKNIIASGKAISESLKHTKTEIADAKKDLERFEKAQQAAQKAITMPKSVDTTEKAVKKLKENLIAAQSTFKAGLFGDTVNDKAAAKIIAITGALAKLKSEGANLGDFKLPDLTEAKAVFSNMENLAQRAKTTIQDAMQEAIDAKYLDLLGKKLNNIKVSLALDEQEKDIFVDKINTYIDDINKRPLHKIKVELENALDVDGGKNGKKLGESTIAQFSGLENTITEKRNNILNTTQQWRKDMIEALTFKGKDLTFEFSAGEYTDVGAKALRNTLQEFFDANPIDVSFNAEKFIGDLQKAISSAGITLEGLNVSGGQGGGTVDLSADSIKSVLHEVLFGEVAKPKEVQQEKSTSSGDDNKEQIKYYKTLTETSIGMEEVFEVIKELARLSETNTGKSKSYQNFVKSLTDRGLDIAEITKQLGDPKVNEADIDALITKMVNNALMKTDNMGMPIGSTFKSDIKTWLKNANVGRDSKTEKVTNRLIKWLDELYKRNDIPVETLEEWMRRTQTHSLFRDDKNAKVTVEKAGRALATRGALYTNTTPNAKGNIRLPNEQQLLDALGAWSDIGGDTSIFEKMFDAYDALNKEDPSKSDPAALAAFQQAWDEFQQQTNAFTRELQGIFGNFKGTITLNTGKVIEINRIKDFLKLAKEDVISDVVMHQGPEDAVFGNIGLDYEDARTRRRANSFERRENWKTEGTKLKVKKDAKTPIQNQRIGGGIIAYDPNAAIKAEVRNSLKLDHDRLVGDADKSYADAIAEHQVAIDTSVQNISELDKSLAKKDKEIQKWKEATLNTLPDVHEAQRQELEGAVTNAQIKENNIQKRIDELSKVIKDNQSKTTQQGILQEVKQRKQTFREQIDLLDNEINLLQQRYDKRQTEIANLPVKEQANDELSQKIYEQLQTARRNREIAESNLNLQTYDYVKESIQHRIQNSKVRRDQAKTELKQAKQETKIAQKNLNKFNAQDPYKNLDKANKERQELLEQRQRLEQSQDEHTTSIGALRKAEERDNAKVLYNAALDEQKDAQLAFNKIVTSGATEASADWQEANKRLQEANNNLDIVTQKLRELGILAQIDNKTKEIPVKKTDVEINKEVLNKAEAEAQQKLIDAQNKRAEKQKEIAYKEERLAKTAEIKVKKEERDNLLYSRKGLRLDESDVYKNIQKSEIIYKDIGNELGSKSKLEELYSKRQDLETTINTLKTSMETETDTLQKKMSEFKLRDLRNELDGINNEIKNTTNAAERGKQKILEVATIFENIKDEKDLRAASERLLNSATNESDKQKYTMSIRVSDEKIQKLETEAFNILFPSIIDKTSEEAKAEFQELSRHMISRKNSTRKMNLAQLQLNAINSLETQYGNEAKKEAMARSEVANNPVLKSLFKNYSKNPQEVKQHLQTIVQTESDNIVQQDGFIKQWVDKESAVIPSVKTEISKNIDELIKIYSVKVKELYKEAKTLYESLNDTNIQGENRNTLEIQLKDRLQLIDDIISVYSNLTGKFSTGAIDLLGQDNNFTRRLMAQKYKPSSENPYDKQLAGLEKEAKELPEYLKKSSLQVEELIKAEELAEVELKRIQALKQVALLKERELQLTQEIKALEEQGNVEGAEQKSTELKGVMTQLEAQKQALQDIELMSKDAMADEDARYQEKMRQIAKIELAEKQARTRKALADAKVYKNELDIAKQQQIWFEGGRKAIQKDLDAIQSKQGLNSSFGQQELSSFKYNQAQDFKQSETYKQIDEEQREQTRKEIEKKQNELFQPVVDELINKRLELYGQATKDMDETIVKSIDYQRFKNEITGEYGDRFKQEIERKLHKQMQFEAESVAVERYGGEGAYKNKIKQLSSKKNISENDAKQRILDEIIRYDDDFSATYGTFNERFNAAYLDWIDKKAKKELKLSNKQWNEIITQAGAMGSKNEAGEYIRSPIEEMLEVQFKTIQDQAWKDYRIAMNKVMEDYRSNIVADKNDPGKVFVPSYTKSEDGEWKLNTEINKVDLKQQIINNLNAMLEMSTDKFIEELINERKDIEAKLQVEDLSSDDRSRLNTRLAEIDLQTEKFEYFKSLPQRIEVLMANIKAAMSYGGIGYADIMDEDLIEEQMNAEMDLLGKTNEREIEDQKIIIENIKEQIALRRLEREEAKKPETLLEKNQDFLAKQETWLKNYNNEKDQLNEKLKQENLAEEEKEKIKNRLIQIDERSLALQKRIQKTKNRIEHYSGKIEEAKQVETQQTNNKPKGLVGALVDAVRKGLAGVTAGGKVDLNAELYDLATESTLRAIFDIISGGGEAGKALDAYKAGLAGERVKNVPSDNNQGNTSTSNGSTTSNNSKAKKNEFEGVNWLDELNKQSAIMKSTTKGTKEYITEQAKLYALLWKYKSNIGVTKNPELYNRSEVKALGLDPDLTNANKRAEALKAVGVTDAKSIEQIARDFVNSFKSSIEKDIKTDTKPTPVKVVEDATKNNNIKTTLPNGIEFEGTQAELDELKASLGITDTNNLRQNNSGKSYRKQTIEEKTDEIWGSKTSYSPKTIDVDKATLRAQELKKVIDSLYDEGKKDTEEYIKAQLELSHILSAMRTKLGMRQTEEEVQNKDYKSSTARWKQYLLDNNIFDNLDNVPLNKLNKSSVQTMVKSTVPREIKSEIEEAKETTTTKKEQAKTEEKITKENEKQAQAEEKKTKEVKEQNKIKTNGQVIPQGLLGDKNSFSDKIAEKAAKIVAAKAKTETKTEKAEPKDPFDKTVAGYDRKMAYAKSAQLLTPEQLKSWDAAKLKLQQAKAALDGTEESARALNVAQEEVARTGEKLAHVMATNEKALSGTNEMRSAERQRNKILGVGKMDTGFTANEESGLLDYTSGKENTPIAIQNYIEAYNKLIQTHAKYVENQDIASVKAQNDLKQQAAGVQVLGSKLNRAITQSQKLQELAEQSKDLTYYNSKERKDIRLGDSTPASIENMNNLRGEMEAYARNALKADIAHSKFSNTNKTLQFQLRTSKDTISDMVVAYDDLTKSFYMYQKAEKESLTGWKGFWNGMKGKMRGIAQYLIMMTSVYRIFGMLRQGIQYIKEIDAALVELRKVTDETEETYDKFLDTASETAYRLGSTLVEVTNATAEFAKLGYSMEMAAEMGEAALVYANVGDGISSAQEAADSIISTLKGFKLEAEDAMLIVDKFNEVGNDFAITSKGIGDALMKSASALSVAGNTIDESVALITAANEVVQDPDSVGTALKTLTLRIRGAKTELQEADLDVENMANTVSSLQQKILGLTSGRVDIMASNDEFKSTTQILRELASVWDSMTDIQQAASLEALGGKRQANILAAIITNFSTVEDVIATSEGSAGSALEENEKRLDSFQGRLNQFTSTVQTKWNEALDTELIKDAIQLMTKLVDTLDFEDSGIIDVLDLVMKGLSGIIDGIEFLTGGNFNLGTTLLTFLGANSLRKYNMWPFADGDAANKNVETLTQEIETLKKANDELLVGEQKTSNIFTKNKYKNQRKKNEKKIAKKEKELAKQQTAEQVEAMKATPKQQEEIAESFDIKKIQSRKGGKANALKQRRTKLASQGKTEAEIAVDPKIKQYTKDIEDCDKAIDDYNKKNTQKTAAETAGANATQKASNSTNQNTGSKVVNEKATEALNADVKDGVDDRINSGNAIDKESQDLDENTGKKLTNDGATKKMGASWKTTALKMAASMAIMQGAMQLLDFITWGINELIKAHKETHKSYEELHEDFEVMNSDLEEQKSELQGLESEFDTIQDQIVEIQSLGSLSFTKQEELDKLKAQSAELERQIELQRIIAENQQGKTNEAALKAAESFLNTSAETNETLTEVQEEGRETGEKWGSLVDALLMIGGGIMVATGFLAPLGVGLAAAGMVGVGKGIGGEIGEGAATSGYNDDQTKVEQLNSYKTQREVLSKAVEDASDKLDKNRTDENIEAYEKAVEKLNEFDTNNAETISQLQEYISSVDYSELNPEQKETYKKINEFVNEYLLANGGSTVNAANSILGYDEYKGEKYRIEDVTTQLKRGDITEEDAANKIKEIINGNAQLKSELNELGLSVENDVVPAFTKLGEKLKEDASLMDSLDKVSAVTSAFDDLGNAVSEFREEGRVSTSTLESLNEKFGDLDEFEGLYNVLATGEGNLEEEISNVANAYVGQIQALAGLTDEEEAVMVKRLEALGVLNAQEVLDARQTAQTKLKQSKLAYGIDLSNYGNAEQAKLAIASAAGLSYADITEDNIKGLAKQYGVDLENYATTEEAKIAIAEARAKAELKTQLDSGEISQEEYDARIGKITGFTSAQSTIDSILENAFTDFTFDFNGQTGIGSDFDEETGMSDEQSKAWEELLKKHQNELDFLAHQKDLIQAEIDEAEAKGFTASEEHYRRLIALEQEEKDALIRHQQELQTFYKDNAASMSADETDEWNAKMRETALAIKEADKNMIEFGNTIREIGEEYFNKVSEDIDAINEEIEFMHGLLEDEPVADENGNWSNEALTRLGLYTQQMESAAFETQRAKDELAELQATTSDADKNTDWYREKEEELTQAIYDGINSYNDAKDGIVELNEARVEAIKEGIEKEIEAMNDLIDAKKSELDAERD